VIQVFPICYTGTLHESQIDIYQTYLGHAVAYLVWYYDTNWKVVGSIPDVIGFFN
jgi:hypothetical protein